MKDLEKRRNEEGNPRTQYPLSCRQTRNDVFARPVLLSFTLTNNEIELEWLNLSSRYLVDLYYEAKLG
jgi:hypothetical protein